MVDQIAVVKFSKPATTGTFDITDPSITEAFSACILIYTRESTDDANQSMGVVGLGFIGVNGSQAETSLQAGISLSLEDGVTSNAGAAVGRSRTTCIRCGDGVGGLDTIAAYDSSIAGGVRLNFTQCDRAFTGTAILFAGLAKAATGECTFSDAGSSHEDVGLAADRFQADLLVFVPSDSTTNADSINAALTLGFCLNKTGVPQIATYLNWDNNSDPTDADGFYRSDVASCAFIGDRTLSQDRFAISSFDSTGFNAIALDTGDLNTPQANYLALKFSGVVRMAISQIAIAAATGNQTFTALGFTPGLLFGLIHLLSTPDTITDGATAAAGGLFATGTYGSRAYSVSMQEGLDIHADLGAGAVPSVARTRQGDHALLSLDHLANVVLQAEWAGAAVGGFVLNFGTASQVGTMTVLGLALGVSEPETEQLSDQTAANVGMSPSDTERTTDQTALNVGLPTSDAERTTDSTALNVSFSTTDIEQLTDLVALGIGVSVRDVEEIADFVVLASEVFTRTAGKPFGWTYGGGAERGGSFQGGAVMGTVL